MLLSQRALLLALYLQSCGFAWAASASLYFFHIEKEKKRLHLSAQTLKNKLKISTIPFFLAVWNAGMQRLIPH